MIITTFDIESFIKDLGDTAVVVRKFEDMRKAARKRGVEMKPLPPSTVESMKRSGSTSLKTLNRLLTLSVYMKKDFKFERYVIEERV